MSDNNLMYKILHELTVLDGLYTTDKIYNIVLS